MKKKEQELQLFISAVKREGSAEARQNLDRIYHNCLTIVLVPPPQVLKLPAFGMTTIRCLYVLSMTGIFIKIMQNVADVWLLLI